MNPFDIRAAKAARLAAFAAAVGITAVMLSGVIEGLGPAPDNVAVATSMRLLARAAVVREQAALARSAASVTRQVAEANAVPRPANPQGRP